MTRRSRCREVPRVTRRYVPHGQRYGCDTPAGYRNTTRIPGPIERTQHVALIWRSMPGGLFLFALCLVALGAIVAFFAASSDTPGSDASSVRGVEAAADKGTGK